MRRASRSDDVLWTVLRRDNGTRLLRKMSDYHDTIAAAFRVEGRTPAY